MGFCHRVYLLPDCIFCPTKLSFLNYPALSPSPPIRELIHLTFLKNTTLFSPNNPANAHRIKVSAREARRSPHGTRGQNKCHIAFFCRFSPLQVQGNISTVFFAFACRRKHIHRVLSACGNISTIITRPAIFAMDS